MKVFIFILVNLMAYSSLIIAGEANVLKVLIERTDDGYFNIHTTVQHDDEGFEHYADRWEVLDLEGNLLDRRVLSHPHSPLPFTRSLIGVELSEGIKKISIRAHDNIHGYGGEIVEVLVPDK